MRDIPFLICGIIAGVLLFLSVAYHDGALALFSFPFAFLTIFGGVALHTYNANKTFTSQKRQIEQTYNVELDISRKQFAKMLDGNKHAVYSPWRKKKDGTIIRKCYLLRGVIVTVQDNNDKDSDKRWYAYITLYQKRIEDGKEILIPIDARVR